MRESTLTRARDEWRDFSGAPIDVYVTNDQRGIHFRNTPATGPKRYAVHVGTYTSAALLPDFLGDVELALAELKAIRKGASCKA